MWDLPKPEIKPLSLVLQGGSGKAHWAAFLICGMRYVGLECSHWEKSHWVFSVRADHLCVCSAVSLFTCCVGSQIYGRWHDPLPHLNCGCPGSQPWFLSGFVFTKPPMQIHWSQVSGLQYLHIWTLCGSCGGSSDPSLSWSQKQQLSIQMFRRHWIHKASRGGVNLWFVQLWGEISALLSKSHDPWRLSCDFSPTSVGGQPTSVYSQGCWGSGQSAGACLGEGFSWSERKQEPASGERGRSGNSTPLFGLLINSGA